MNGFSFEMTSYDGKTLLPQIAWALEKRTEQESHRKMPGLWKLTDRLRTGKENAGEEKGTGKAFLRSAKKFLDGHSGLGAGDDRIAFATLAMTIRERGKEGMEEVPYSDFERVVETRDLYPRLFRRPGAGPPEEGHDGGYAGGVPGVHLCKGEAPNAGGDDLMRPDLWRVPYGL